MAAVAGLAVEAEATGTAWGEPLGPGRPGRGSERGRPLRGFTGCRRDFPLQRLPQQTIVPFGQKLCPVEVEHVPIKLTLDSALSSSAPYELNKYLRMNN